MPMPLRSRPKISGIPESDFILMPDPTSFPGLLVAAPKTRTMPALIVYLQDHA
jgi:hypothetical protein